MDDGQPASAVRVRVGVGAGDGAGGGPAGMPDGEFGVAQAARRGAQLADILDRMYLMAVVHGHAPGIIPAIFQFLESIEYQAGRLAARAGIAKNTTHEFRSPQRKRNGGAGLPLRPRPVWD